MAVVRASAWRAAADPDDLREYDRFGPWLDRVHQQRDLPRRFRPWYPELAGATHLVKVPRDLDRAQVRPGMDLYRSVLAVFADHVVVLNAEVPDAPGVARADIALADVVATRVYGNLLAGCWTLLLADGSGFDVPFNSVSEREIAELDRYVLRSPATDVRPASREPAVTISDHFFRSRLGDISAATDDPVRPVHVEEPLRPCRDDRGRRRVSSGVLVLETPTALVVVDRDSPVRSRFRRTNYATNTTTIPFARITSFAVVDPPADQPGRFGHLVLRCGRQVIAQPVLTRPDAAVAALEAHGVRAE
ncbi:MAG: hypothetical protein QM779_13665 [Propionicimonas sp.]|uniref:hypothetical protein n=1 Tax=Propionicimonas sp. TaxID=1955623 RepID=UPI003D10A0B2